MRVMDPKDKIEFFCKRLCAASTLNDHNSSNFIPKLVELGILFLNDENKHVRHEVGQTLIIIVSLVSAEMDKAPGISKKRDKESLKMKLRDHYRKLERLNNHFPQVGPRYAGLKNDQSKLNENGNGNGNRRKSGAIYIGETDWNKEWDDDISLDSDIFNQPSQSYNIKTKLNESTINLNVTSPTPAPNMKLNRENSSDIAVI